MVDEIQEPIEIEEQVGVTVEEPQVELFDPTKYAIVATVARNGMVLLYEIKNVDEAKAITEETITRMNP